MNVLAANYVWREAYELKLEPILRSLPRTGAGISGRVSALIRPARPA